MATNDAAPSEAPTLGNLAADLARHVVALADREHRAVALHAVYEVLALCADTLAEAETRFAGVRRRELRAGTDRGSAAKRSALLCLVKAQRAVLSAYEAADSVPEVAADGLWRKALEVAQARAHLCVFYAGAADALSTAAAPRQRRTSRSAQLVAKIERGMAPQRANEALAYPLEDAREVRRLAKKART